MTDHEENPVERFDRVRDALTTAISDGQVHPAVADFLSLIADALAEELSSEDDTGDTGDKTPPPTPADVAKTNPTSQKRSPR